MATNRVRRGGPASGISRSCQYRERRRPARSSVVTVQAADKSSAVALVVVSAALRRPGRVMSPLTVPL